MVGTLGIELDRSRVDSVRVFPSGARLEFDGGRLRVDTLRLETSAALLTAVGGIGLHAAASDTLRYTVIVDSLGGLRPYLRPRRPSSAVEAAANGRSGR